MSKLLVKDIQGKQTGECELSDELLVFDKGLQAVHDAVVAYQANQRAGTASTLTKGEVRGSGKKPWKQKGMGRARAGYRQSPVWRGGGVTFGPKPRNYRKNLPKKMARLAFRRAFSDRVAAGNVVVIEELTMASPKTKEFAALLERLAPKRSALFIVDELQQNMVLASRNVPKVEVVEAKNANIYQILRYPLIVVTRSGLASLEERLKISVGRK